jgi:hypothetical protein
MMVKMWWLLGVQTIHTLTGIQGSTFGYLCYSSYSAYCKPIIGDVLTCYNCDKILWEAWNFIRGLNSNATIGSPLMPPTFQ